MVYRVVSAVPDQTGTKLKVSFVEIEEEGGKWSCEIPASKFYFLNADPTQFESLNVKSFLSLHKLYGAEIGKSISSFISEFKLEFRTGLVASPGYSLNQNGFRIGEGAAIAAITKLPVVSDFYALDDQLGGTSTFSRQLEAMLPSVSDENVMYALMAVLRWRQSSNVFSEETGAERNTIGGALWMGDEN